MEAVSPRAEEHPTGGTSEMTGQTASNCSAYFAVESGGVQKLCKAWTQVCMGESSAVQ